ncbi:MAG: TonB-dependent receptor [Cytophagaceae bacterium]|nr:MAG: TonB-dependent receptor [Cytophagaceae bacterium]
MKKQYTGPRHRLVMCCLPVLLAGVVPATARAHALHPAAINEWQLTGRVTNEKGEGLPGVTVVLKGTTKGTSSGADGSFTLSVPETAGTIVFSFIGYTTQERKFNSNEKFTVRLVEDSQSLDDVVVVGYGTQKRADVTSAIATFEAGKQLTERPITRVDQALVGQLAGVQVQQTSGVPGRAFSIQVRGTGSLSAGNEPLYVIDGFPLDNVGANSAGRFGSGNPLDNINPNDIESIEVLKDAAAAAIYGSRAANGVVLITTKKGRAGKAQITVNSYAGISQRAKKLDLLSTDEWIERAEERINNDWVKSGSGRYAYQSTAQRMAILGVTAINPTYLIDERWNRPGRPGLTSIDWQDAAFRKVLTQNHQVSAAGATDNVSYYVSGNYADQPGIVIGLAYRRYSARANVEIKANKKLRFGLNLTPTYSVSQDPGVEGKDNRLHQLLAMSPIAEDTAGVSTAYGKNYAYKWAYSAASPVEVLKNAIGESRTFRTLSTAYAQWDPLEGLSLRSTLNFDNNDTENKNYQPAVSLVTVSLPTGSYSSYRRQTFVNENTATYTRTFGKSNFTMLAGQSYNFSKLYNTLLTATGGFINNQVNTLNAATTIAGTGNNYTTETQSVLISYFGRLNYAYDGKYLLSASVRADGSSRFGSDNQYGTFPAVSLGWRISQEKFLRNVSLLTDLKLRASLGYAGNNTIGDYSAIPTLGFYNYTFGGTSGVQVTGQAPNRTGNSLLRWEKNRTFDYGIDLALFDSRIYISADYYTKTSKDLLLNIPVPTASGFGNNLQNIGEVQNQGWEIALNTRNLEGAFSWTTSFNLAHNENKVVHLAPGDARIEVAASTDTPHSILQVGLPMYSIFVVRQAGILSQADIDSKAALFGNETAGDPKYEDVNNDGKIDANDRQVVAQPNPKYTWGITNTFRYKGFDLSFLVQGQNGGSIYSLLGRAIDRTSISYLENGLGRDRDRWRSADSPGDGVKGKIGTGFGFIKNTDWLYSSDYFRFRFITLGYDLARLVPKKIAQGVRVYVTAENFFGHDKYYGGLNPDAVNTSNNGTYVSGVDYGGLPLSKNLILGANITF